MSGAAGSPTAGKRGPGTTCDDTRSVVVPGLDDIVGQRTQVNTVVANPFANMAISPRIQLPKLVADAPSLMVACGLALRRFDT